MSVGLEGSDDVEEVVRVETSERARQSMEAREKERVGLWGGGGGAERVGGGGAREKGILVDVNVLLGGGERSGRWDQLEGNKDQVAETLGKR
jgi:hypothetical protein